MLGNFVLSSGYYDAYYKKAKKVQQLIVNSFDEAFEKCTIVFAQPPFPKQFLLTATSETPASITVLD